jgi:hypothetical protein
MCLELIRCHVLPKPDYQKQASGAEIWIHSSAFSLSRDGQLQLAVITFAYHISINGRRPSLLLASTIRGAVPPDTVKETTQPRLSLTPVQSTNPPAQSLWPFRTTQFPPHLPLVPSLIGIDLGILDPFLSVFFTCLCSTCSMEWGIRPKRPRPFNAYPIPKT